MSAPALLVVEDDPTFRRLVSRELGRRGFETTAVGDGTAALAQIDRVEPDVMLLDLGLPDMGGMEVLARVRSAHPSVEVIILTGEGTIDHAIEAVRLGACDFRTKPCALDELEVALRKAVAHRELLERNAVLEGGLATQKERGQLVGHSGAFVEMLRVVNRIAASDATVLVQGETGTGKERVAELVHASSARRDGPYVVVDCASLHEGLLQSELFGHEKGAFTGAQRLKHGLFEVAHGGTLFLDEVGEITPATQVKLLRVLESRTLRRLGGTKDLSVDVRVVAATNRDLRGMMTRGEFREDLYYRLANLLVAVPPLREREGDVRQLALHFAARYRARNPGAPALGEAAVARLERYHWPGNVRQLLHTVEQAMVMAEGREVLAGDVPLPRERDEAAAAPTRTELLPPEVPAWRANPKLAPGLPEMVAGWKGGPGGKPLVSPPWDAGEARADWPTLAELEDDYVRRVLAHVGGHRGQAARILGISERNLYRKIREME